MPARPSPHAPRPAAGWADPDLRAVVVLLVVVVVASVAVLRTGGWTGPRPAAAVAGSVVSPAATDPAGAAAGEERPLGVTVHVVGAVAAPGLVDVPNGARVGDAVAAALPTVLADVARLNLARVLVDGEQVVVPRVGERVGDDRSAAGSPAVDDGRLPDGRLDLNRATAAQLQTLDGVGPVLAGRIVAWREQEGPFRAVPDLREVTGIGEKTFLALADAVGVAVGVGP